MNIPENDVIAEEISERVIKIMRLLLVDVFWDLSSNLLHLWLVSEESQTKSTKKSEKCVSPQIWFELEAIFKCLELLRSAICINNSVQM